MRKTLSLLLALFLMVPSCVYAAETPEKTELLMIIEENTSNKEIRNISNDAGGSVENINKLNDDTKLVKITVNEEEIEEVSEILENEDKVIFVQPNYTYTLEEDIQEDVGETPEEISKEESPEEEISEDESPEEDTPEDIEEEVTEDEKTSAGSFPEEPEMSVQGCNDTYLDSLWHLNDINAFEAWEDAGSNDVIVAVIDSGCQTDHPDLNLLVDKCVSFLDGTQGSFTAWDNSDDDHGHGTHVCGIIAATVNNNTGVAGVSNNKAKIIAIDATNSDSAFSTQDVVLSIDYAVRQKAKVINLSLGGVYRDYILDNAINSAYENGAVCVCAAGNENTDKYSSPSDAYGAISVMSHDKNGNKLSSSNYGKEKDVSAPGRSIYSTAPGSSYTSLSGTSMATPVVAGIAALLFSRDPNLTPREIKNIIYATGNNSFGTQAFGRVNAKAAMDNLAKTSPASIILNKSEIDLYPGEDEFIEYSILPGGAYSSAVSFESSDTSVATIDNGNIIAVSPGSSVITVSSGNIRAYCNITVKEPEYKKVNLPYTGSGELTSTDPRIKLTIGSLVTSSYMDGYEVTLEEGSKLTISLNTSTIAPFIRVLKDGKAVGQKYYYTVRNCDVSYTANKTGVYQIQVMNYPTGEDTESLTYTISLSLNGHTHTYQTIEGKAATCTEDGWESYKKCSCGEMTDLNGNIITEIPVIKASHDWEEDTFSWDGDVVTAKRVCRRDASHTKTETVTATSEVIKEATLTENGLIRYTARFNDFETQIREVATDKLTASEPTYTWNGTSVTARRTVGNDIEEETVNATPSVIEEATCTSAGLTRYTAVFKNSAFETQTKDVVTPVKNHSWAEPTYTWNENKVTAKRVCAYGHSEEETVTATSSVVEEATCTSTGLTRYTAAFKNSAFETQTKDVITPVKSHSWAEPTYTWNENKVTAKRVCVYGHSEEETVTATSSVVTEATCTSTGLARYTAVFKNSAFETQTKDVITPVKSHSWSEPTYTWNGDKVTAKRVCAYGHSEEETVTATSEVIKEATLTENGLIRYTARFSNFETQIREVATDKLTAGEPSYTWDGTSVTARRIVGDDTEEETVNATPSVIEEATCTSTGLTRYTAVFKNSAFETQTKDVITPVKSHSWSEPTYTWNGDKVTAKRVCAYGHSEEETVTATSEVIKEATLTENGLIRYTARFSNFETQIREVATDKLTAGEPSYTWSGTSVTARRTVGDDFEEETVNATPSVIKEATCASTGLTRYTAAFKNSAFETQTKDVITPVKSHSWAEPTYTWGENKATAKRVCAYGHSEEETVTATSSVVEEATCTSTGISRYTAVFKDSAFETQTKDVITPVKSHSWSEPTYTWNGNEVTAKRVCAYGHSEEETVTATLSGGVYTATFKNSAFKTQTKTDSWSEVTYSWSSDYSTVTASKRNLSTDEVKTETARSKCTILIYATCTKEGSAQYTATFKDFPATAKTVKLPMKEHKWLSPAYVWSRDNSTVKAARTCTNGHSESETVRTTSKVTKAATTYSKGETTYTAKFNNKAFATQTKTVANIDKLKPVIRLPKVKTTRTTKGRKAFTVKWKKLSKSDQKKISGIQVQYSPYKNFNSGVKTIKVKKTASSKKISKLSAKKTYYVRVRTYKSGYYSAWSAVKKIKTK